MSVKKFMFIVWVVASLLWLATCFYWLDINNMGYAYRTHDRFAEKVARGRTDDPMHWDYNLRGYNRARKMVSDANKNLGLFILIGFGVPGIMLSAGTMVLRNVDTPNPPHRKKTKA